MRRRFSPAEPSALGLLVRMGLDFGGDEIAHIQYDDGDDAKVTAGGLFSVAAGILYHPDAPWALEATIGYKFDRANAANGNIQFRRIPVDVVVSYANSGHRIGGGATVHLSPKASCDIDGLCNDSVEFDNALGAIVQYVYGFGRDQGFEIGARGTFIKYRGDGLETIDGTCFGLILGGWL